MTREAPVAAAAVAWEESYNNKSLSGIEVCDRSGKLVNFINIRHEEILQNKPAHRIQISLDENAKPLLPPPQTFDEMIQAKRRHQMLLYGSGTSSSAPHSAPVATTTTLPATSNGSAVGAPSLAAGRSKKSTSKKKKTTSAALHRARTSAHLAASSSHSQPLQTAATRDSASTSTTNTTTILSTATATSFSGDPPTLMQVPEPAPGTSNQVITSMKDLNKHNPIFKEAQVDPKDIMAMLKSAPPGHSIILPNGTIIKKSRRGGARAGAGRKRSRPLPGAPTSSASGTSN